MSITIDLPEDILAALQADANAQGRTAEEVAAEGLVTLYMEEEDEDSAIEEGLRELEEGKGRPLAEFAEEFSARFEARYGRA